MIAYASRTGTASTLAALRAHGWRLLMSAANDWRHEGMPFAIDNGAFTYAARQQEFDSGRFAQCVAGYGSVADFVVVPDVVGNAAKTFELAEAWLPHLTKGKVQRALVVLQDGAEEHDVDRLLKHGRHVGLFLGGSTEWKVANLERWGRFAQERGRYYHVGRVNSLKRLRACASAGADSFDGTSAVQFPSTIPDLDRWRREGSLEHGPADVDAPRDYEADAALVAQELRTYRDDETVELSAGALRALLRQLG